MSHIEIYPAILSTSIMELDDTFNKLASLSDIIHIDIADGVFVKNKTYPYISDDSAAYLPQGTAFFSVHFMVQDPTSIVRQYIVRGAKEVFVHVECFADDAALLSFVSEFTQSVNIGFAVRPETSIEQLINCLIIAQVKTCMIMTLTEIGVQGSGFDSNSLSRIKTVRSLLPDVRIVTDGAINESNIVDVVSAGANACVVGSALVTSSDPADTYQKLLLLVNH